MKWKNYFDDVRLKKGYEYYVNNRIYDVVLRDSFITSKIEGSHNNTYEIKIDFDKNNITSMYCSCPYALNGLNCKHMAATLYKKDEIESEDIKSLEKNTVRDKQLTFKEILTTAEENVLKDFIYDKFQDDDEFIDEFLNSFQTSISNEEYEDYKSMLLNILSIDLVELYNTHGYYDESPFYKYLKDFIDTKINLLYNHNEYEYVIELIYIIYGQLSRKINEDDYMDMEDVLDSCNNYMAKIIDKQDKTENDEMFNYFINSIRYEYNYYTTPSIIKLLISKFTKKEQLQRLYDSLKNLIDSDNEIAEDIYLYQFEVMKLLDYPLNERYNYLEEYKEHDRIMNVLVDKEIKDNNIDKAIELLNENKEIHGKLYSLENTLNLIKLYQLIDDKKHAAGELKSVIYEYNIADISFIKSLKGLLDIDEWILEKNKLIKLYEKQRQYPFLNELYVIEEDYDKLYENITNNCSIDYLEVYRKYIADEHDDEIINIYKQAVLNEAKIAKHVGTYPIIINYLKIMLSYSSSTKIVLDLIKVLKKKYENKKALINLIEDVEVEILTDMK